MRARVVEATPQVAGQDPHGIEGVGRLEQERDLSIGVALVSVACLAALAERRLSLVEEPDSPAATGLVGSSGEVRLGLADIVGYDHRQIDAADVTPEHDPQQRCADDLAGAGRAREQRVQVAACGV
jgi:hypothetical protein